MYVCMYVYIYIYIYIYTYGRAPKQGKGVLLTGGSATRHSVPYPVPYPVPHPVPYPRKVYGTAMACHPPPESGTWPYIHYMCIYVYMYTCIYIGISLE